MPNKFQVGDIVDWDPANEWLMGAVSRSGLVSGPFIVIEPSEECPNLIRVVRLDGGVLTGYSGVMPHYQVLPENIVLNRFITEARKAIRDAS